MKKLFRNRELSHRTLGFERMEDRLALSATTGVEYTLPVDFLTVNLNVNQGGFIQVGGFNAVYTLSNGDRFFDTDSDIGLSTVPRYVWNYSDVFNGNLSGSVGAADVDQIAPIPQPNNQGKLGGIIELTNIFQPTARPDALSASYVQQQTTEEAARLSAQQGQLQEPSLARARDVYFEVATLSVKAQQRGRGVAQASREELVSLNHEAAVGVSKSLLPAAELRSSGVKNVPPTEAQPNAPLPKTDAIPKSAVPSQDSLRAAENGISDPTTTNALQEKPVPTIDELSRANAHDAALTEFWIVDDLADEHLAEEVAVSLRSNEGGKHYAAWPALAALIGGSLVVRQRRTVRPALSQVLPLRQKFVGPSRGE